MVEAGSHDELLAKAGVYARLYRLQFAQEVLAQKEAQQAGQKDAPVDPAARRHQVGGRHPCAADVMGRARILEWTRF